MSLGDCSTDGFMALLEYLYSDHAPIEQMDAVDLLSLSDRFCQPRLINLIELYTSKHVEKACEKSIQRADIDVIGLLHASQVKLWASCYWTANWCQRKLKSSRA